MQEAVAKKEEEKKKPSSLELRKVQCKRRAPRLETTLFVATENRHLENKIKNRGGCHSLLGPSAARTQETDLFSEEGFFFIQMVLQEVPAPPPALARAGLEAPAVYESGSGCLIS